MNADLWLRKNKGKVGNQYEILFANSVLPKVEHLDWGRLSAQRPITDIDGRQRFIDFAIEEGESVRIAIEVDGYDKRGVGSGMTHREFLDWQRREASLVSQGWVVIRFANRDVRDRPERCSKHISLLLRNERAKTEHVSSLLKRVKKLENEIHRRQDGGSSATVRQLQEEKDAVLEQLEESKSGALTGGDKKELADLDVARSQIHTLKKDSHVMKTTIWALVFLIVAVAFILVQGPPADFTGEKSLRAGTQTAASSAGTDCGSPLHWRRVSEFVGQEVAASGPVVEVSARPDLDGAPIWINIGRQFPNSDRLAVVVWGEVDKTFENFLETLPGENVCVIGEVASYKGVAQIEITSRGQLQVL